MGLAYQPHYAGLAVDYSNLRGLLHAGFVDAPVFADALAQHRFILGRQQRRDVLAKNRPQRAAHAFWRQGRAEGRRPPDSAFSCYTRRPNSLKTASNLRKAARRQKAWRPR
jgi:hypothetical protein